MDNKNEMDNIFNSLDGLQKASPGPFFYTRVHARLQREETGFWGRMASFITKPKVALATLGLIFLLNAAAFFYQQADASSTSMADTTEQATADEYNTTVASNSYYNENTAEAR